MLERASARSRFLSGLFGRSPEAFAALALALVVVGPLLLPGYVLAYDMVFVPRPTFTRALLGISPIAPRSVPTGLLVAMLSRALTGQVVQKLILLGIFGLAAYGAATLVPASRLSARLAAGVLYAFNPLLFERILLGHWALLLGYALLPWVVKAALAMRAGRPDAGWRLVLAVAATMAASPYTGLIGGAIAMAVVLMPPWERRGTFQRAAVSLVAILVVNLPWLVPALIGAKSPERPGLAQFLFRARSDSPLGTLGSIVSLGGLWRSDLAPPGRSTVAWIPAFALIAVIAVIGWRALLRNWSRGAVWGLLGLSAAGVLLAWAPNLSGPDRVVLWLTKTLPGGGVLRDSQKFAIPLALSLAIGFGVGVDRVLSLAPSGGQRVAAALLLPLLPVALAPTLAGGVGGRLRAVDYPSSWGKAAQIVAADPVRGAMLVLPWHAYLPFPWNQDRVVLDPAGQYFSRRAVTNTSVEVGPFRLPPEDPWTRLADPLVRGTGPLASELSGLGVRYVLVLKTADWRAFPPRLQRLALVLDAPELSLYRAAAPRAAPRFSAPAAWPVIVADGATVGVVGAAALILVRRRRRVIAAESRG